MGRPLALLLLAGCAASPSAAPLQDETRFWIDTCSRLGFTPVETAMATGLEVPDVVRRSVRVPPTLPFTVLPYPGGRHPRLGFFDGAVDPHRDTKAALLVPGGGYAVVDLPEAVWADGELQYLAHTHIPTAWDKKGVKLPRMDWTRRPDGGLEARRVLPDGLEFSARITSAADGAEMELRVRNGGDRPRRNVRAQVCVMLGRAEGFAAQSKDNKRHLPGAACAARSADGGRWLVVRFEDAKTWDNPPCPCIHSDPQFGDLAPGAEVVSRGRLRYAVGDSPPEGP